MNPSPRIAWRDLGGEPFRLFFPLAVLAGLAGVAVWPLHFAGWVAFYPGQSHARLMAYGFFGGFVIGFLGTSVPRMLSAKPLHVGETLLLSVLYAAMVGALLAGKSMAGDVLFLVVLGGLSVILGRRVIVRRDIPPPGFVLVLLALLCAATGAILSIRQNYTEDAFIAAALQHLLVYQGFILLPIMGVGAFLLPRFFGLESRHNFPESVTPPAGWTVRALGALVAGLLIIVSFGIEAIGWVRGGPALRLMVVSGYLAWEVPFYRAAKIRSAPASILRLAIVLMLTGFVAIIFFPAYRISLLHLTLIGGFAMITFTVATRVIFGHSGNLSQLNQRTRWLWTAVGLMLLAMATRISGDIWPNVLISHYNYGAAVWILAVILWSVYVLPKVIVPDSE